MVTDYISAGRVASLLAAAEEPSARRGAAIASRLDPKAQLRLSRQPAARTAKTLRIKYSLARDRGVQFEALDELVASLVPIGDGWVLACVVEGAGEFAVVVLSDTAEVVEAALYVLAPGEPT